MCHSNYFEEKRVRKKDCGICSSSPLHEVVVVGNPIAWINQNQRFLHVHLYAAKCSLVSNLSKKSAKKRKKRKKKKKKKEK